MNATIDKNANYILQCQRLKSKKKFHLQDLILFKKIFQVF